MIDSVSLDDAVPRSGFGPGSAIILFLLFLVVLSDFVLHNVVSMVSGTVVGREATSRGVVVQGVILVLAYAGLMGLADAEIL